MADTRRDAGMDGVFQRSLPTRRRPAPRRTLPAPLMTRHLSFSGLGSVAWLTFVTAVLLGAVIPPALAEDTAEIAAQRALFLRAETALKEARASDYQQLLGQLKDYPLYPYLLYQSLKRRLATATEIEVEGFLAQFDGTPLASRLRRSWLTQLYRKQDWRGFRRAYRETSDATMRCRHLFALYQTGERDQALASVPKLWRVGHSQPRACDPIFKLWLDAGLLEPEDAWGRIRLAMQNGRPSLARYVARFLPESEQALVELWRRIRRQPEQVLDASLFEPDNSVTNEILIYGIRRWAKSRPEEAARAWETLRTRYAFSEAQAAAAQREIGLRLARAEKPEARQWLSSLDSRWADRRVTETLAIDALKREHWREVLDLTDGLQADRRGRERWQYWRARSLEGMGESAAALDIFSDLAGKRSFYGFLSADRLQRPYFLNHRPTEVDDEQATAIADRPGARRARELFLLGRNLDARREWYGLTRDMSEEELRAAAVLAHRWGWHDRAILTLGRTGSLDDIELRFPLPYREPVLNQSRHNALDPAWVYAVLRQESAFAQDARSPKGAMGLMQLLPRTARQMARRLNDRLKHRGELLQADTNIRLGSAYLRRLLDQLVEHPALATAAYNAGPHRVRQWLPENGARDAVLWIEDVPFKETRNYLRRVFTYTAIYQQRLGQKAPPRISDFLPPVPGREEVERSKQPTAAMSGKG